MKSTTTIKELPISEIQILPEVMPRLESDWHQEHRYAAALDAGAKSPPICVVMERGQAYLIDGRHRINAFLARQRHSIDCEILDLPRDRWLLEAAARNDRHGFPLTYQDKLR